MQHNEIVVLNFYCIVYTFVSRMPLYRAVKVEVPSVAGGGQKVVPKSVRFLVSILWSFVGSLFLAVLTECKGQTLSCGILFLWIAIQHLLCSGASGVGQIQAVIRILISCTSVLLTETLLYVACKYLI